MLVKKIKYSQKISLQIWSNPEKNSNQ